MGDGMTRELPDDPGARFADRVIKAVGAEFADDDQVPRFVVVVEYPPDGHVTVVAPAPTRIGIASTGDDEIDTHRLLAMAAGTIRKGMSDATKRKARQVWELMAAGFERRQ